LSLFVSIVLFVSAGAFGMYLNRSVTALTTDYGYDLNFHFSGSAEEMNKVMGVYQQIKEAEGVSHSLLRTSRAFDINAISTSLINDRWLEFFRPEDLQSDTTSIWIELIFIDDENYSLYLQELGLSAQEHGGDGEKLPAYQTENFINGETGRRETFDVMKSKEAIKVTLSDWNDANFSKEVSLSFVEQLPTGVGIVSSGLIAFAPFSARASFVPDSDAFDLDMTFQSEDTVKTAEAIETILRDAGISNYGIFNVAQQQQQNRNILLLINVFTYGFVILISLITIANVFNTISTSIKLRRREIAMLKSVGMTDGGLYKMMSYESIVYGARALLYGIPVSIGITWLIYRNMDSAMETNFTLPWSSIIISILSVFLVVFITMLYSITKIKKENTIDALKAE
jgi:putative ABC transport system permease protein